MKAKLIPSKDIQIEISGKVIGTFRIESEWENFVKLKSRGPNRTIIIFQPPKPTNVYDMLSTILGENKKPDESPFVEGTIVSIDFDLEKEFGIKNENNFDNTVKN